jgi:choline dehydrogenase
MRFFRLFGVLIDILVLLVATTRATLLANYMKLLFELQDATCDLPVSEIRSQYDFIIVGAGPGGSTLANRLTEVPTWRVLLLEAGGEESRFGQLPIAASLLQHTHQNWGYLTEPDRRSCLGLEEGRCPWHRGKGMGGTSMLNTMLYMRGHPRDYDAWEVDGNPGWGWDEVFKYFLKSENAKGTLARSKMHSRHGYLDVERPYVSPLARAFLASAVEIGYPVIDYNSGEQMGFSLVQVTQRNGSRLSANKAFLQPIRNRKNLHVAKKAWVTKVMIHPETKRATAVEFYRGGRYWRIRAKKEIILSAGVFNTPQILMLSGIGPRKHLHSLGIKVVRNLPGVGRNMQEHVYMGGLAFVVNETVTLLQSRLVTSASAILDYYTKGKGPFTSPRGVAGFGFIRTALSDKPFDYPDIELMFLTTSIASDGGTSVRHELGIRNDIYNPVYTPLHHKDTWTIWPMLLQPKSRGKIKLRSNNPFDKPLLYPNHFSEEHDLLTLVEGIKFAVALSRTKAFQRYNSTLHDIPLPPCQGFIFASDDYWRCTAMQLTTPGHHQCCTAKMGPANDSMAVVDAELKVHGVFGLRVVDASIMPNIPAAHTMAPTYMIAERAADLIKREHGFNY